MSSRMRSSGQRLTAPALTRRLEQADPAANTAEHLALLDERARADLTAALAVPRDDPAEGPTPVPCPAPRRSLRSHRALAVSAAACAVAVATAGVVAAPFVFGESSTRVTAAQISTYGTSAADAGAVAEMPSAFNAVVSNGPGSWERLAAESDLVAVGRLDRLQEGRTNTVAGETAWVSTVVVRTVQGELPEGFDGHLYVELPLLTGFTDLQMWQRGALPAGTPVLVYLRHAWDGSDEPGQPPYSNRLVDPAQGRPAGQALYEAYYPSSFIVQADDRVIVWPAMRSSSPGTLADVLPDGAHAWPDWNRQVQR